MSPEPPAQTRPRHSTAWWPTATWPTLETEAGPGLARRTTAFLIVYTSGTTSRPKGCFHTFNTVRASATAIMKSLDYTEHDVQFGPSPVTHSTGLVTSVVLPLIAGAQSYLMEAWDPQEGLNRIEQHGCTAAVTATPFLQMLMGAYDPTKHDASSMRLWVCAGSPIPGAIVEQLARAARVPDAQPLRALGELPHHDVHRLATRRSGPRPPTARPSRAPR